MNIIPDKETLLQLLEPSSNSQKNQLTDLFKLIEYGHTVCIYAGYIHMLEQSVAGRENPEILNSLLEKGKILTALSSDFILEEAAQNNQEDTDKNRLKNVLKRFPAGDAVILTTDEKLKNTEGFIGIDTLSEFTKPESKVNFIDLKAQQNLIEKSLELGIHRVLNHGMYILGPEVKEAENRLAEYVGTKHCITVGSGTDSLLVALMAIDLNPGDEVITSPFTFAATVEAIVLLGGIPVYVDIEPDTCNIIANDIQSKITEKTKAIIPVSLYGQVADMDRINEIARANGNIPVIEDAAQSFGALYRDSKSCGLSDFGCTSFYPSKPLGVYGEGGAVFTNDDGLAELCREIRHHGQHPVGPYNYRRVGFNFRLDSIQCAVLLSKMEIFDDEIVGRIRCGQRYNEIMDKLGIERVLQRTDRVSVFAQYTVMVDERERIRKELSDAGIPTAVHYPRSLNSYDYYKGKGNDRTPNSYRAAERVLSLPFGPYLSDEDMDRVVKALNRAIG